MPKGLKITVKQEKFAEAYVEHGDAGKAYEQAGYSMNIKKNSRYTEAHRLLKNPLVSARIAELMDEIKDKRIASAEEVLQYLTSVMRGEMQDEVVTIYDGITNRAQKNVDAKDKNKAAELLGKRYRLFVEKIEQTVESEITVTMDETFKDWSK